MTAGSRRGGDRWRKARRRTFRKLADRTTRRRILLVLATLVAVGVLAAIKGLLGYFVFSSKSTRIEVALTGVAIIAGVFALCERKVAAFIESRFNRNTREHREGLAQLRDELAEIPERHALERRLVERFDALFRTRGTVLYVGDGESYAAVAHSRDGDVPALERSDPLVNALRASHVPVVPADAGATIEAPLAWPLRARGDLVGILVAGEHDYLESFDAIEIEAVQALADSAAANLAFLDPTLTAHLVHTPNNLPPLPGTFVGRKRELAECRAILAGVRLLTLTGFGGAGKSRLARELAQAALVTHRSGVFWTDLAEAHDEAHVASAIAAAIGATEGDRGADAIATRIGNGDALLVLDTCEHAKPTVARIASDLLQRCPRMGMLLTSQSPLGIPGERDFAVPPLAIPEEGEPANACEGVALFVERARAAVPGQAFDDDALRDVAAIVRALDGIPLAIELAAARLKVMSLASVRAHLDESLKLLGGGEAGDTRHHTMRASIEWSYDPLVEADQRLLRRLSVFAGGFTLEGAARVGADASDPLDVLDPVGRLAEASLLLVTRNPDGEPRYHLPETLRQFLGERLARDPDAERIRARHAAHHLDLALHAARALHHRNAGTPDAHAIDATMQALDREAANLAVAHRWLLRAPDAAGALELAHALVPYWRDRGLVTLACTRIGEALAHPAAAASARPRAEALLDAAMLDLDCLEPARAAARASEADSAARALADDVLRRRALALRARAMATGGPPESDVAEALERARGSDDVQDLHAALRDATHVAIARGDLERARALLGEAIELALASHAKVDGEHDLEAAAALASARGDPARAARYAAAAAAAFEGYAQGSSRAPAAAAALREALGAAAFESETAAGRRWSLTEALSDTRAWLA
ncbi:MAG: hypothetical protein U1F54_01215 [Burkholderiales bacterium]